MDKVILNLIQGKSPSLSWKIIRLVTAILVIVSVMFLNLLPWMVSAANNWLVTTGLILSLMTIYAIIGIIMEITNIIKAERKKENE